MGGTSACILKQQEFFHLHWSYSKISAKQKRPASSQPHRGSNHHDLQVTNATVHVLIIMRNTKLLNVTRFKQLVHSSCFDHNYTSRKPEIHLWLGTPYIKSLRTATKAHTQLRPVFWWPRPHNVHVYNSCHNTSWRQHSSGATQPYCFVHFHGYNMYKNLQK